MVVNAERDIQGAADAAECVVKIHFRLVDYLRAGRTLAEVDHFVAQALKDLDCKSAFRRYRIPNHAPFPSHACLSVNDCIVHGTHHMSDRPLQPGDIFKIDIGTVHHGWIGDAAWTYAIEHVSDEAAALMQAGRVCLQRGLDAIQAGRPLMDWARTVQSCVEDEFGFYLVRGLGGHGYGKKLHGPPFVSNVKPRHRLEWPDAWTTFQPGMLLALEPMLALSTDQIASRPSEWPIYTSDGSISVHYEADVMVTENGVRNLTELMFDLPDVVG